MPCPRCATASCTRSSPPRSCSPAPRRSPTACAAFTLSSPTGLGGARLRRVDGEVRERDLDAALVVGVLESLEELAPHVPLLDRRRDADAAAQDHREIGRASCRERGEDAGGVVGAKK